jgi:mannose-6-phosphate isomerase-like protein (cupin superfamily)
MVSHQYRAHSGLAKIDLAWASSGSLKQRDVRGCCWRWWCTATKQERREKKETRKKQKKEQERKRKRKESKEEKISDTHSTIHTTITQHNGIQHSIVQSQTIAFARLLELGCLFFTGIACRSERSMSSSSHRRHHCRQGWVALARDETC